MPSVIINEKDYTIYNKGLESNNIVYVPGFSITGPIDRPVLLTEYRDLVNIFGNIPPKAYSPSDSTDTTYPIGTSWEYAAGLLNAGFPVLFRRIVPLAREVITTGEGESAKNVVTGIYDPEDANVDIYNLTYNETPVFRKASTTIKVDSKEIFTISEATGGSYGNRLKFSIVLNAAKTKLFYKLEETYNGTNVLEYFEIDSLENIKNARLNNKYILLNSLDRSISANSKYLSINVKDTNDTTFESKIITAEIKNETEIKTIAASVEKFISRLPLGNMANSFFDDATNNVSAIGTDGVDFTIDKAIEITSNPETKDKESVATLGEMLVYFLSEIEDKIQYDVKFITKGNIGSFDDKELINHDGTSYATAAMNLCSMIRTDCMVITEPKIEAEKDEITDAATGTFCDYNGPGSSYVAAYAPWAVTTLFNGYQRWMAPSFIFLVSLAKSVASGNPSYLPPAGVNRASLPEVVKTQYPIGSKLLDKWQNKDYQINLNPIMQLNKYGYVIYGQRTLYDVSDSVTSYRSALQEVGVRLTTLEIKKKIYEIAIGLTFEYNNIHTWNEFKSQLEPLLVEMLENGALQNYKVIMDMSTMSFDDIDDNKIRGTVKIIPGRAVEDFIISFELYRSSVKFDDEEETLGY